jgi:hypothetical protein
MKAKLRRLQKEKLKQSQSNITNSLNESQNKKQTENKNNQIISSDNNNIKNTYSEKDDYNLLKKELNPEQNVQEEKQEITPEEYKQQELSKIATMFNFEVDKKKKIINIKENDEYYDMRKQINDLEQELENTKNEYDILIQHNQKETQMQKEQIEELENELKRLVDYNIENLKKENIMLVRDVNLLDKKLDSVTTLYQKEQFDMNLTINELDSTIKKLKDEIFYVEDLKLRLKKLSNKEIPQELINSINLNFNIKEDNEEISNNSQFVRAKSKNGSIPIADILDVSSIDSKRSIKKLYI